MYPSLGTIGEARTTATERQSGRGPLVAIADTCGVDQMLTMRQAFDAMRRFLAQYNEREPIERRESITQLLRWTETESDGGTYDPAQWHGWEQAVESVVGPS